MDNGSVPEIDIVSHPCDSFFHSIAMSSEDEDFDNLRRDLSRQESYSKRIRDWGERHASPRPDAVLRRPSEADGSILASLSPPLRRTSSVAVSRTLSGTPEEADSPSLPSLSPPVRRISGVPLSSTRSGSPGGTSLSSRPSALPGRGRGSLTSIPEGGSVDSAAPLRPQLGTIVSSRSQLSTRPAPSSRGLAPGGVSLFEGPKTVRLSVLPISTWTSIDGEPLSKTISFTPRRLLDIENGTSIVVEMQTFLSSDRYNEIDDSGALIVSQQNFVPLTRPEYWAKQSLSLQDKIQKGSVRDFSASSEVGVLGGAWRGALWRLMVVTYDETNVLLLTRQLQLFMPFLASYEAYVVDQVIESLEQGRKKDIKYTLKVAYSNRNVSRILVQLVGPRYDFLWHWNTQIAWNRAFDIWGRFPVVGITSFPATENFQSTRNGVLASMFRRLLGPGNWVTRVITRGRQGLVTDDPDNVAQNLAAESNGFEAANRNQYGTYIGRRKTNEFRFAHGLPTDESLVRTFMTQPLPTMVNNGVVHVLRQLAKHWHNMLFQFSGNFAHQRMEQLNPFETLRFHMPVVLVVLSSLRGRNQWDSKVLAPMVKKLQELKPSSTADAARLLVRELEDTIVINVCGGVASMVDPFRSWLDAMYKACDMVEEEAKQVYDVLAGVEIGIRLGHDLITHVSWKVPSDKTLKEAILNHIRGSDTGNVVENRIRSALTLITPRDKRTLIELVKAGLVSSKPAQLLLGRARTLLQRELRREVLNQAIRELSKGDPVTELEHDEWYWLEFADTGRAAVYIYDAKVTGRDQHRFLHVDTKYEIFVSLSDASVKCRTYVPVGEAISRAQRAYMNLELDNLKKFSFNAYMEFTFLHTALRRLIVISQLTCEELDNARLNVLAEVQRSNQTQLSIHNLEPGMTYYTYDGKRKEYTPFEFKESDSSDPEWKKLARTKIVQVPPQSMIVVGGGPTGLMTVVHCTEAVLMSGGVMKLYEARDAFAKGGATFERAQIVRLDARWIAMLRYHLGTGYEDVYVPASGETDAQLGNSLPTQGFVEITIKDLENMLHVEVSKMWSKGLIQVHTDSKSNYDYKSNALAKLGEHLKIDDTILRRVNEEGQKVNEYHSWKVVEIIYVESLSVNDLKLGEEYGIYIRLENEVIPHKLMGIDLHTQTYTFMSLRLDGSELKANAAALPYVYPKGTVKHAEVSKLIVESVKRRSSGGYVRESFTMKAIKKEKFMMDVGHTHVVEAIGKVHNSDAHFSVTTYEPYGTCCIQGLKISMGMHNFGEKRWGTGLLDDIRSQSDTNTRIIGDFTKMVRSAPPTKRMLEYMTDEKDKNWQTHFAKVAEDSGFPQLNEFDPIVPKIQKACFELAKDAPSWRRQTLQTRFFETGDNYYLGMEFTREYDKWKNDLAAELVASLNLKAQDAAMKKKVEGFKGTLMHHLDRLWYDGVLEVIRTGDVYNPGARHRVPRLYLISSYSDVQLGSFPVGESFRLSDDPKEKYEIVIQGPSEVFVRNVEGFISKMPKSTLVKRESNLTRGPDGNAESRVALSFFPVGHYVNFRTCRLNDSEKGYVFAFMGDQQATPHFMRYSGLTGGAINAMLFNNFIHQANCGIPFVDRLRLYSIETNWSNGEVVQRGTGANYGEAFLRPGFPYDSAVNYLHSKVIEYRETDRDLDEVLSRDWKIKLAASMVPRGMELNEEFIRTLYEHWHEQVFEKFVREVKADERIVRAVGDSLESALRTRAAALADQREVLNYSAYWDEFLSGLHFDTETKIVLEGTHTFVAKRLDQICNQVVEFATKAYLFNERVSSELYNQPKSVDSIIDDFAVESQSFTDSLMMSAAFSAGALSFTLINSDTGNIVGALLGALNIIISFTTMTNVSRYKIRNEEARIIFAEDKMLGVMTGVFSVMDRAEQDKVPLEQNPFVLILEKQVATFVKNAKYYDYGEPKEFLDAYHELKMSVNDPEKIRHFQHLLVTRFIADVYQVNSYLQEYLVNIFKTLEDMHRLLTEEVNRSVGVADARKLFDQLTRFRGTLDGSLQRGYARFGFLKKRHFTQWDIAVVLKYFYSFLFCARRSGALPTAPITTQTLSLVKQAQHVSAMHQSLVLRREIRDLEALYWATRESEYSSLIFVAVFGVLIASIVFSISRLVELIGDFNFILQAVAFWATLASAFVAILAVVHLWRKLFIMFRLKAVLGGKVRNAPTSDDRDNIRKVASVTSTQIILTVARLLAALGSSIALPWAIAQNQFGGISELGGEDRIRVGEDIPFWIALGAVGTAFGTHIFFHIVEFVVRYKLSPKLGEFVCESFRVEIEAMYRLLAIPINDIATKQVQERETWEYVAREFLHRYRFDTIFAADRFGSILQYIQAGMDPR